MTLGSMAVLFTIAPCGARLPPTKLTVLVRPRARATAGAKDHVVGVDAVRLAQPLRAGARRRSERSHQSSMSPSGSPVAVRADEVEQAELAQVQHHLRDAAGQEHAHGRVRAVGQRVHEARHAAR